MKLLHTVPSIDLATGGGLGSAALALHRQLLAHGEQSTLITTSTKPTSDRCENVITLPLVRQNLLFYGPRNRAAIDTAVRNADVVHTHGLYTHLNYCVGQSCRRWRKPLVYHPHGTLAPWYLRKRRLAKRMVHWLFEDRNFQLVRQWRAVSEREKRDIQNVFPRAEVVVIPNGIDPREFEAPMATTDDARARRRLLFIGRLAAVKGLDLLVRAWMELANFHCEWQLLIAGPDFENYQHDLLAQVAGCSPDVAPMILEPVSGREKVRLLKSAELFVLPSRAEGLPVTVLEALACSTPVVVTTACNFTRSDLGDAGWICEPTVENLKETLVNALACNSAGLRAKGEIGRRIVETKFSRKRMSDEIVSCSKAIVDLAPQSTAQPELVRFDHATVTQ